ncbi:hypothetical protein HK099_000318 [Clydaea vesicula]|uniref:Uncharacterized protein n=1 Tax=Clydaea vesicula TaxID=447962 RepID=A0AAD5U830_9FUNG|nr:hypothetical protein HK099_000318 [Clydaea vesicula]KAJ3388043.1 hypothetical protein HDU92_001651 [Lobulomyces angularis]
MTSSEESVKADREEVQLNKTEFEKHLPTQTMTASEECVRADREEILKEEEKPTFEAIRTKSAESSG